MVVGTYRTAVVFHIKKLMDNKDCGIKEALPSAFVTFLRTGLGTRFAAMGAGVDINDAHFFNLLGLNFGQEFVFNSGLYHMFFEDDMCLRKTGMAKQQLMCFGSHCKLLKDDQLKEYKADLQQWCRDRDIPLDDPAFYEYQVPWWRTTKLYLWVEGPTGLRTAHRNYLYFNAIMPILFTLHYAFEQPWSGAIAGPVQLMEQLHARRSQADMLPFGRFPMNKKILPFKNGTRYLMAKLPGADGEVTGLVIQPIDPQGYPIGDDEEPVEPLVIADGSRYPFRGGRSAARSYRASTWTISTGQSGLQEDSSLCRASGQPQ
jgi:hypothetical protein